MQEYYFALVWVCVVPEPLYSVFHAHVRLDNSALIHECPRRCFLRYAAFHVFLGVVSFNHVEVKVRSCDGDVVGVGCVHSGTVFLASGNLDQPTNVRHIVQKVERRDLQIQTVHPVTDLLRWVFRSHQDDPVQRHQHAGCQVCQKILAANKPDTGSGQA